MSEVILTMTTLGPDQEIPWTSPWRVITMSAILFSGLLVLLGNTFTIVAICKFRVLRDVVSNLYLLSLSISSLVMVPGLILIPASVYGGHTVHAERVWNIFVNLPVVSYQWISCLTVLTISFDRLIAVKKSMQYKIIMSRRNVLASIALTWTVAFGVVMPLLVNFTLNAEPDVAIDMLRSTWLWVPRGYVIFQSVSGAIVPVVIAVIYAVILSTLIHTTKESANPSDLNRNESNESVKTTKRRVKMMGILVMCVFGSHIPVGIYLMLYHHKNTESIKLGYSVCATFQIVCSTFNPFVYCWQNRSF
ncbi:hypothetical protein CAPTEDRAFT_196651, partial [Capitella teleta]